MFGCDSGRGCDVHCEMVAILYAFWKETQFCADSTSCNGFCEGAHYIPHEKVDNSSDVVIVV